MTAIDLDAARGAVRGDGRRSPTTTSCSRSGAQVNFFGVEGAAEHAFPMYTLADAVRLKEHVLERWEAADQRPVARRGRGAQHRHRRRRPDRRRERRRARRALPQRLRQGLPEAAAGAGAHHPRRGGAGALRDVQEGHPRRTRRKALEKRGVEVHDRRGRRVGRADARHARSRARCWTRTRSSGARACRRNPIVQRRSASSSSEATASPSGRT